MTQAHKTPGALVEFKPIDPREEGAEAVFGRWMGRVLEVVEEHPRVILWSLITRLVSVSAVHLFLGSAHADFMRSDFRPSAQSADVYSNPGRGNFNNLIGQGAA